MKKKALNDWLVTKGTCDRCRVNELINSSIFPKFTSLRHMMNAGDSVQNEVFLVKIGPASTKIRKLIRRERN